MRRRGRAERLPRRRLMDRGAFENILAIGMSMWHMDDEGGREGARAQDMVRRGGCVRHARVCTRGKRHAKGRLRAHSEEIRRGAGEGA